MKLRHIAPWKKCSESQVNTVDGFQGNEKDWHISSVFQPGPRFRIIQWWNAWSFFIMNQAIIWMNQLSTISWKSRYLWYLARTASSCHWYAKRQNGPILWAFWRIDGGWVMALITAEKTQGVGCFTIDVRGFTDNCANPPSRMAWCMMIRDDTWRYMMISADIWWYMVIYDEWCMLNDPASMFLGVWWCWREPFLDTQECGLHPCSNESLGTWP